MINHGGLPGRVGPPELRPKSADRADTKERCRNTHVTSSARRRLAICSLSWSVDGSASGEQSDKRRGDVIPFLEEDGRPLRRSVGAYQPVWKRELCVCVKRGVVSPRGPSIWHHAVFYSFSAPCPRLISGRMR